ncbi:MAG: flagellar biosynthesis anti-sigma factor FlgM [Desulfovibrionaceae bacterium]|nr:flagellar biosynthesis anti-sigma factor FlgM [Desulfovibrionaceae bacterium]
MMDIKNTGQVDMYNRVRLERPGPRAGSHPASARGAASVKTDTVSVSDEAVLRTEAYRTAMNAPDIREDKVNAMRDQIANGTYTVNAHRIAANMLGEELSLYS